MKSVNKSEKVREYLRSNPNGSMKDCKDYMWREHQIRMVPSLYYQVSFHMRNKSNNEPKTNGVLVPTQPTTLERHSDYLPPETSVFNRLMFVKAAVNAVGGPDEAKNIINLLYQKEE